VSFLAIAPENTLLDQLVTDAQKSAVKAYIEVAKTKSELQRKDLEKDKTGVFTGIYAINPVNQQQIPIYVADYVLNSYATGIVMGVPAHDARDYAFAQKYQLPITYVIDCLHHDQAFEGDGKHINSDFLNGLNNQQAIYKMNEYLSKNN
jgi:leucyl-tRNA synthetase